MSGDGPVRVTVADGVMGITLDRPQVMNALSPAMLDAIDAALVRAEADPAIRCLVLTGTGKAFCAGADLSTVPSGGEGLGRFLAKAGTTMATLARLPKPVIAALNGTTLAGGLELALCADIVVAARSARIGDGHIRYGLLPGGGGSARLIRAIGGGRARYLLYSGATMSADDLERWGLVQRVFADEDLPAKTAELTATLVKHSPLALAALKRLAGIAADADLDTALAAELAENRDYAGSHDMREGLAAFAEKRTPLFVGR